MPSETTMKRALNLRDFSGGLNNKADLSSIANNELASIINLELDTTGALVARPPITRFSEFPTANAKADLLGYYTRADGITFAVIAQSSKTYLYNPGSNVYTQIASFAASGCAQYQNRLYICSRTARGGWWGEVTPGSGVYTYQSLASGGSPMPFGDQIVLYKDRLWISGWGDSDERTKVYLSEQTDTVGGDINNWPPLNFIFVSRGDGQWITRLHAGTNDLTIFRNGSAYYFIYENDPADGTLSKYEGTVGSENKNTVVVYQNSVYTLSNGSVYQLLGYQFYRRNDPNKLEFERVTSASAYDHDAALSVVGNRLLVWYQGNTYSLDLTTFIWSQWESTTSAAMFRMIPRPDGYFGVDVAYGVTGVGVGAKRALYRIVDEIESNNIEEMNCRIRTKAYDFDTPDRTKVIFWWSLDALSTGDVAGTAVPIILGAYGVTEDDLLGISEDILELGTEDYPLIKAPGVITDRTSPAPFPARLSFKFTKKMRFRRIYFEVSLDFNGTLSTGPAHIFGLVVYVDMKQKVTKGVN